VVSLHRLDRQGLGDRGMPHMRSAASLLPLVPVTLVFVPLWYFDPPAKVRYWVVGAAAIPMALLFGIWGWRVAIALKRHLRQLRDEDSR
jgi:uncharacterized membrane protein YfcA